MQAIGRHGLSENTPLERIFEGVVVCGFAFGVQAPSFSLPKTLFSSLSCRVKSLIWTQKKRIKKIAHFRIAGISIYSLPQKAKSLLHCLT